MSKGTPPAPQALFDEKFYQDVAHGMDPEQEISPEAINYLNCVANVFMDEVLQHVISIGNKGASPADRVISDKDIYYVLQEFFGMSLPGWTGPLVSEKWAHEPTQEYSEKLDAVRTFAASHADD